MLRPIVDRRCQAVRTDIREERTVAACRRWPVLLAPGLAPGWSAKHCARARGTLHREKLSRMARAHSTMGMVKEKTEPLPGWLVTEMVPPWASTMALEMASPMPV